MRKVLLICSLIGSMTGYASQNIIPVQPTMSQFSPVVLKEDYYIANSTKPADLVNLYASLQPVVSHRNVRTVIVYDQGSLEQVKTLQDTLLKLGMDKKHIILKQQAHPLYPIYVIVQSFGKKGIDCQFKHLDGTRNSLQGLKPCYLESNKHIQAVF